MAKKKLPKVLTEYCIGCGHYVLACHLGVLKLENKKSKSEGNTAFKREGVLKKII